MPFEPANFGYVYEPAKEIIYSLKMDNSPNDEIHTSQVPVEHYKYQRFLQNLPRKLLQNLKRAHVVPTSH